MKIYKVCEHGNLESFTRMGWHLEQTLMTSQPATIQHTAPAAPSANPNQYSNPSVGVDSPVVVCLPMFLLSKESEFENREIELTKIIKDKEENETKQKREIEQLSKDLERRDREARDLENHIGTLTTSAASSERRMRKLEGDLAKVRTGIGQIAYDKLVGGPAPT